MANSVIHSDKLNKKMITLTASMHLLTPAFLGGANHEAQAIRITALKSALRWWWRAHRWAHLRAQSDEKPCPNVTHASRQLWREEMALFGSASHTDEKGAMLGGQGAFLMRLDESLCTDWDPGTQQQWTPKGRVNGLAYLLGQGLWSKDGFAENRNALAPGTFNVQFLFKPVRLGRTEDDIAKEIAQVANALWLLCHLGGVGARSRRGWGSLSLDSMAINSLPGCASLPQPAKDPQGMARILQTLMPPKQNKDLPPITAFSGHARIVVVRYGKLNVRSTAVDELKDAGLDFQAYRKETFGADDAMLVRAFNNGVAPQTHPKRVVFGLGHNYFMDKGKVNVGIQPAEGSDRRASPLLIHLHQWPGSKAFSIVYSLLPAKFLPDGVGMVYSDFNERRADSSPVALQDKSVFWQPAKNFMAQHAVSLRCQHQAAWPIAAQSKVPV